MPNKPKPNLQDYSKTCKEFRWEDAEKKLVFSGKNRKFLNIARNISRNAGDKTALLWESSEGKTKTYSFSELEKKSNQFANFLKKTGIRKGDRCFIFLPRVPELYFSFLGILKIGAIAGTLFPAFGPEGLETRLRRGQVNLVVTNKELLKRLEKTKNLGYLKHVVVVDGKTMKKKRWKETDYSEILKESPEFNAVKTKSTDPAVMLFTSATSYTPVAGIVLPHKALIQQTATAEWCLDLHPEDVYWCTADPGWITGVVYGIIAPLALGIKIMSYEGRFDPEKWYDLIEKYRISILYTAPTAIRMLMQSGAHKKYNLSSLRHICSVGEALNPAAIKWSKQTLGLPIYDNYWQTETGAIVVSNYRCLQIKPGSMGKPVPGIKAAIIDENGKELGAGKTGNLALKPGWPAMMSAIWKRPDLYKNYFKKGFYMTKDSAYKNRQGYYFFVGRADDIIKTAGERVNPFEVESALMEYPATAETAVIGKPDPTRGEIIAAFIVLKRGYKPNEDLKKKIQEFVKKKLAGHAYPKEILFAGDLPKNRSGKIVRRILKNLVKKEPLGDVSTLQNPECIEEIKKILRQHP
jgi:acetyl-CoA synthetase